MIKYQNARELSNFECSNQKFRTNFLNLNVQSYFFFISDRDLKKLLRNFLVRTKNFAHGVRITLKK